MISDRLSGPASRRRRGATSRFRLPFAAVAVALAVFAAHIVEQRLSARTALAEGEEAFRRGDFSRAADTVPRRARDRSRIDRGATAARRRV